jgi:hypothetical protein
MPDTGKILKKKEKTEKALDKFKDLLESIPTLDDKKKVLWLQIYENATNDRNTASLLFTEVYSQMQGTSTDHTSMGNLLTKYLERMYKSNEQLIKLAELVDKSESDNIQINEDDIFSKIQGA